MGVSKGAELVANLAIRYPEIDNIVLYTPTAYNYQGINYQWEPSPSFTWRGEPVDYVRLRFLPSSMVRSVMNLPVSYRKTSEQALAEATNLEAARIPIEKFSGHGLLFAGDQDAMWPADTAVRELSDRNKTWKAWCTTVRGICLMRTSPTMGQYGQRCLAVLSKATEWRKPNRTPYSSSGYKPGTDKRVPVLQPES